MYFSVLYFHITINNPAIFCNFSPKKVRNLINSVNILLLPDKADHLQFPVHSIIYYTLKIIPFRYLNPLHFCGYIKPQLLIS